MDHRKFLIYYKVNISDEIPGEKIKAKTADNIEIKHQNILFSVDFLLNFFKSKILLITKKILKDYGSRQMMSSTT